VVELVDEAEMLVAQPALPRGVELRERLIASATARA